MTEAAKHPLRDPKIAVYALVALDTAGPDAPTFIAKILPMKRHPIFFSAATYAAAEKAARDWCSEQADKYEAAYLDRLARRKPKKAGEVAA